MRNLVDLVLSFLGFLLDLTKFSHDDGPNSRIFGVRGLLCWPRRPSSMRLSCAKPPEISFPTNELLLCERELRWDRVLRQRAQRGLRQPQEQLPARESRRVRQLAQALELPARDAQRALRLEHELF